MRIINANDIIPAVQEMIISAQSNVEADVSALMEKALNIETSPYAKECLNIILENNRLAKAENAPACQDTGLAVFFIDIGCKLHIEGNLTTAINEGVRRGYADFRKSAAHPLTRLNTNDNTPAVIYYDITDGDRLTIKYLAKGAGSENMSKLFMLTPSQGERGIIESVLDTVKAAGANPCPPIIIGVGIGGTMEKAAILSKYALTRPTGTPHKDKEIAALEHEILDKVNALKIGVQGLGGETTALGVHIETFPTHIGMLPVAVNIQCHSVRHKEITL